MMMIHSRRESMSANAKGIGRLGKTNFSAMKMYTKIRSEMDAGYPHHPELLTEVRS